MKTINSLLGVLCIALAGRVASAQTMTHALPSAASESLFNTVTVQNDRNAPVTLYLASRWVDQRLGVVPPFGFSTLALPQWATRSSAPVKFIARPQGASSGLATDELHLRPQERIGVSVPSPEAPSTAEGTMSVALAPEDIAEATITVENLQNVPVSVVALKGSFETRLGNVAPNARETLRLPKSLIGRGSAFTVFLRPRGGLELSSNALHMLAGEHLAMRVPQR